MFKDIGFLLIASAIVYDALTGRVSGRGGAHCSRKEHPIFYWVMTPILMLIAALLVVLALYDIYRRGFA
jgi:hypothetical protein